MFETAPPTEQSWARRASQLAMALSVVAAASLQGCSSVPLPPSGTAAIPAPTNTPILRPDRDSAPERPPEDLTQVPDAVPRVEPILPKGPNKPYMVEGQGYEPLVEDKPFKQRGVASWYGTKFHGRRTASGEVYSMYGMSAAHRTLPIPSYVRVRNVANGKDVILRVNDRGPFHAQRVLDVSYTAAAKLDILARGSAEVEIERLTFDDIRTGRWAKDPAQAVLASATPQPAPTLAASSVVPGGGAAATVAPVLMASTADPVYALASRLDGVAPAAVPGAVAPAGGEVLTQPLSPPPEVRARAFTQAQAGFWVQLAAFSQRTGVENFQKKVAQEVASLAPLLAVFQEGPGYRVQVGPFSRRDDAQGAAQRVRDALKLSPMVVERR